MENFTVRYMTDEAGNKQAVIISLDEWRLIQQELALWREYSALKMSLEAAFQEVELIKSGLEPRVTLSEFLNGAD
jgi:hypothetical protein